MVRLYWWYTVFLMRNKTPIDNIYWFFMKIIPFTLQIMFTCFSGPYFPTSTQQNRGKKKEKKEIWFPDIWQTVHTKPRKVQYPAHSKADPAETSPLLWRVADRVTTRKQVRQNSFVHQVYFDIGLFGGLWMSGHGCENTKLLLKSSRWF